VVAAEEITVLYEAVVLTDGQSTPIDFGVAFLLGESPQRIFVVRNDGKQSLVLGAISAPAGFSVTGPASSVLLPGSSTYFTVTLETGTVGVFNGNISLANSDSDENPFNFIVTGEVQDIDFQIVYGTDSSGASGSSVSIPVFYTASDEDSTLTGIGVRIHYDSSKLTWDSFSDVYAFGKIGQDSSPQDDIEDYDGDPSTDKYLTVAWLDIGGQWPG
jgi:hypothetical protein